MKRSLRVFFAVFAIILSVSFITPVEAASASSSKSQSVCKIVTQPKTTYAKNGTTAKVTVKASGKGLKYQWYFKNSGATKYSKSTITSATYSVKMSAKVNNRYVYCVVKNKSGKTVKSKAVQLRMKATITTQPKGVSVKNGATAKVTVKAAGNGLKYQWYFKNSGATKYTKSSVTSSTYSVKMSSKVKNRTVYCVVKDKYGNSVKSNVVKMGMKITHSHSYQKIKVSPTCTKKGYTTYICSCGDTYKSNYIAAAHNYRKNVCMVCGAKHKNYNLYKTKYNNLTADYNAKVNEFMAKIEECNKNIKDCQEAIDSARSSLYSLSSVCPQWYIQAYVNNWHAFGSTAAATQAAQNAWSQEYNSQRLQLNNAISMNTAKMQSDQQNLILYNHAISTLTTQYNNDVYDLKIKYGMN